MFVKYMEVMYLSLGVATFYKGSVNMPILKLENYLKFPTLWGKLGNFNDISFLKLIRTTQYIHVTKTLCSYTRLLESYTPPATIYIRVDYIWPWMDHWEQEPWHEQSSLHMGVSLLLQLHLGHLSSTSAAPVLPSNSSAPHQETQELAVVTWYHL